MPDPTGDKARYSQQDTLGAPKVGETPRLADDEEALEQVQEKLDAAVEFDTDDSDAPEAEDQNVEEPDGDDGKPAPKGQEGPDADSEADSEDEELGDQEAAGGDETPEPSTPPAAWQRSLKARGWSDDEISAFWGQNPEMAAKVFERVHTSRNAELTEWARLGREAKKQHGLLPDPSVDAPETKPQPKATEGVLPGGFQPLDAKVLAEQGGIELPVAEALVGPINELVGQFNQVLPIVRQNVESTKNSAQAALQQVVDGFFGGDDMQSFAEFYGDGERLTDDQLAKRGEVLETADALVAGATLQGRGLTVPEALTMAHDMVAIEHRDQIARRDLKKKVRRRAKGLSLRPSQRKAKPPSGKATRTQLERRVQEGLTKLFNT